MGHGTFIMIKFEGLPVGGLIKKKGGGNQNQPPFFFKPNSHKKGCLSQLTHTDLYWPLTNQKNNSQKGCFPWFFRPVEMNLAKRFLRYVARWNHSTLKIMTW